MSELKTILCKSREAFFKYGIGTVLVVELIFPFHIAKIFMSMLTAKNVIPVNLWIPCFQ